MSPQAAWGAPVPTLIPPSGKSSKEREPPVSTVCCPEALQGTGAEPQSLLAFHGVRIPPVLWGVHSVEEHMPFSWDNRKHDRKISALCVAVLETGNQAQAGF